MRKRRSGRTLTAAHCAELSPVPAEASCHVHLARARKATRVGHTDAREEARIEVAVEEIVRLPVACHASLGGRGRGVPVSEG